MRAVQELAARGAVGARGLRHEVSEAVAQEDAGAGSAELGHVELGVHEPSCDTPRRGRGTASMLPACLALKPKKS